MKKMYMAILALILLLLFASMLVPVKFGVSLSELSDVESDVYLCDRVDYTGAMWELVGDRYGLFDRSEVQNVIIEGFELKKEFSDVIINHTSPQNIYVIYGEIVGERLFEDYPGAEPQKVIRCESWDILCPIRRGDSLRPILPERYLTIYDIKWTNK